MDNSRRDPPSHFLEAHGGPEGQAGPLHPPVVRGALGQRANLALLAPPPRKSHTPPRWVLIVSQGVDVRVSTFTSHHSITINNFIGHQQKSKEVAVADLDRDSNIPNNCGNDSTQ